jgi:hypothetical protein
MRKGPGNVYDKWNISVVICDTDIQSRSTKLCVINTIRLKDLAFSLIFLITLHSFSNTMICDELNTWSEIVVQKLIY